MVHQYKLNGYNIVLDTCSGSVHSVDDVAYDIIAMYKTASREEIVDAVMKNADTAMYQAKASGRNNFKLFTPATLMEQTSSAP